MQPRRQTHIVMELVSGGLSLWMINTDFLGDQFWNLGAGLSRDIDIFLNLNLDGNFVGHLLAYIPGHVSADSFRHLPAGVHAVLLGNLGALGNLGTWEPGLGFCCRRGL